MNDPDADALRRLMPYVHDAIDAQEPHVADQLYVGLAAGHTSLRFAPSVAGAVVVVSIDGTEVAEVDLRNLLDENDPE